MHRYKVSSILVVVVAVMVSVWVVTSSASSPDGSPPPSMRASAEAEPASEQPRPVTLGPMVAPVERRDVQVVNRPAPESPSPAAEAAKVQSAASLVPTARYAPCQPFLQMAVEVGWPPRLVTELERVMWRESRCLDDVTNRFLNRDGTIDRGLLQVNSVNHRFLIDQGVIESPADLYDPVTNLKAGLALYRFWGSMCPWNPDGFCDRS